MAGTRVRKVEDLVGRHGRMVFATAYRILGRSEDAEDVLQDVFLKLLGKGLSRPNLDAVRNWGAWLRVAATRRAVDILRRNRKRECNVGENIDLVQAPAADNPRNTAIKHENAKRLREALGSLPKRDARVFALRYFEDFSYQQIAESMKMKENAVGVVLHRARERLRDILKPARRPAKTEPLENLHPNAGSQENSHVTE